MFKTRQKSKVKNWVFLVNFAWNFGFWITIPLIIFIGIGIYFDNKLNLKPFLTLTGLILGLIGGIYTAIKEIKKIL